MKSVTETPGAEITPTTEVAQDAQPVISADQSPLSNAIKTPEDAPGGEKPVESPVSHPEDLAAANERLKQQNAQQAKVMAALGLDPMSDVADQLEKGVITEDVLRQHITARFAPPVTAPVPVSPPAMVPAPVTPETLVVDAQQAYDDITATYNKEAESGQIQLATNKKMMDAIQNLNEAKLSAITHQFTARDEERQQADRTRQVDENVEAVLNLAHNAEGYAELEVPLKNTTDMVTLSLTGFIADREAGKLGLDSSKLTNQQISYFGQRAITELGALKQHYINVGAASVRNHLRPNPTQVRAIPITPAGPGGSPVPAPSPYATSNIANHAAMARNFVANAGTVQ